MKSAMLTVAVLSALASQAVAGEPHRQQSHNQRHYAGRRHHQPHHYYGHPQHGYRVYHHASTYEEGVLRGAADVIRAQGEFNLNTSAAAINLQHARSLALDVKQKKADVYFAMRNKNRAERFPQQDPAVEQARRTRIAAAARPNRLGPSQYQADLGLLNWPTMLLRPEFESQRRTVDAIVSFGPGALSREQTRITQLSQTMRESMRGLVREAAPHDYMQARRFLASLQYESQLASRGVAVASR